MDGLFPFFLGEDRNRRCTYYVSEHLDLTEESQISFLCIYSGSAKGHSELYHETRTTDPQVVVGNKTHVTFNWTHLQVFVFLNLKLAVPRFSHDTDPLDPEYYKDISEIHSR